MTATALGSRLERQLRSKAALAGNKAAVALEINLRRNFQPHRKTGATQAATSVRLESVAASSLTWVAKAETPQARYVNDGTQPHEIHALNAPFLVFFWERLGRVVRFRSVQHPGYRGSGWWDFTLATWPDLVETAYSSTSVPIE